MLISPCDNCSLRRYKRAACSNWAAMLGKVCSAHSCWRSFNLSLNARLMGVQIVVEGSVRIRSAPAVLPTHSSVRPDHASFTQPSEYLEQLLHHRLCVASTAGCDHSMRNQSLQDNRNSWR